MSALRPVWAQKLTQVYEDPETFGMPVSPHLNSLPLAGVIVADPLSLWDFEKSWWTQLDEKGYRLIRSAMALSWYPLTKERKT